MLRERHGDLGVAAPIRSLNAPFPPIRVFCLGFQPLMFPLSPVELEVAESYRGHRSHLGSESCQMRRN